MYQDRGMKKWIGFYLAEHSDNLKTKEKASIAAGFIYTARKANQSGEVG